MDLAKLKKQLEAKLLKLAERAEEIDDDLSQAADDDWDENAIESADDEVLEEVGDVTNNEIRQIKQALFKIDAGTYGTCNNCKGPIAKERLSALPYATQCIKCS